MSEMVEVVAKAICRAGICGPRVHVDEQVSLHWRKFELEAHAAIDAINAEKIRQHSLTWQEDH
jgi:hypothetical protein